jgi:hypothetical protein
MGVDVKKAEIVSAEEGKRLATMFGCIASATALSAWASWVSKTASAVAKYPSPQTDAEIVDVVEGTGKCAGMAGHIIVRCSVANFWTGEGV